MPVYSHSKLQTYENCPRQYKLRYVDRIDLPEGGEGIEAFLGSRVHEVLEKLHKELILTKLNSLEDLFAYYKDQWEKNWHDNVLIVKKGFKAEHYRSAGKEAIASYYKRHHPFNQSKTLSTEQLIAFKIDNYSLRGFIDRLSCRDKGLYEIHDYKTSGTLPSQEKLDGDRQLALYQIGIKEKFRDARDVRLIWHYLIFDKEFTSSRSDSDLRDLKKQVVSLIKTIEKDTRFNPAESNLCDWCEYPEYCPAKRHEINIQDLPPNKYLKEKGVSLVNKFASIKSQIKALRDQEYALQKELNLLAAAAAAYAKKEGITNITGSDYGLKVIEETVINFPKSGDDGRKELENAIQKAGIWEEVSGLNLARLSKVIEAEGLDRRVRKRLMFFAEECVDVSVRLVKKRTSE